MIDSIQNKAKYKNNFMIYYQGFLAVAALLVFFTKFDQYLQGRGFKKSLSAHPSPR